MAKLKEATDMILGNASTASIEPEEASNSSLSFNSDHYILHIYIKEIYSPLLYYLYFGVFFGCLFCHIFISGVPFSVGMLARVLDVDWVEVLEEIGLWIPAEVINKEHDDKPEGAEVGNDIPSVSDSVQLLSLFFLYLFFCFARQPTLRELKQKKFTKEKDWAKGKDQIERCPLSLKFLHVLQRSRKRN